MAAGEHTESRAGVTYVRQTEDAVDDRNRVVQRHAAVDNDHHPAEDDLGFDGQQKTPNFSSKEERVRLFSEHLKPIQKCLETLIKVLPRSPCATVSLRDGRPLSRWSCGNLRQAVHLPFQPPMFLRKYKNYDPRRHSAALETPWQSTK